MAQSIAAINDAAAVESPRRGWLPTTKLSPPRLRSTLVERPHLLHTITSADAPVTFVCAPAGYGKSTLITHWLIATGITPAWVSLDLYDNDQWTFFSLIVGAIEAVDPSITVGTHSLLDGDFAPAPQAVVRSLLRDLEPATRPLALVLDDYHVINDPDIHRAMGVLIGNLPPNIRVILITRTEPPLAMARLRGRQDVLELGQDDLRFSDDEALELLQQTNGVEVTPGQVNSLNLQTEGWVAGLQLVSHVLRGQSRERVEQFAREFSGSVRSIDNYLCEEVIDKLPDDVRTFLTQTSLLDRFNASLCDAITARTDSSTKLRQIENERLFLVSLDATGRWYRFHHLFADVLRDRLAQDASEEEVLLLHTRAALWLQEHGHAEEAARHAIAARNWDLAIPLLEATGKELFDQDRVRALYEWLCTVPEVVLRRSPQLAFLLSFGMVRTGRVQEAAVVLRIAEEAWMLDGNDYGRGMTLVVKAYISFFGTDPQLVVEHASRAAELFTEEQLQAKAFAHSMIGGGYLLTGECPLAEKALAEARMWVDREGQSWLRFSEMVFSGGVLTQMGKLPDAEVLLRHINSHINHMQDVQYKQSLFRLGEIYLEWNDLDEAEQCIERAEDIAEQSQITTWRSWLSLTNARIAWSRGDVEKAFAEIERAGEFANSVGWSRASRNVRAYQARFWLSANQISLAKRWMESCDLDPYLPPQYNRQVEHLTIVRILIADGRAELALKILGPIASLASANQRAGDLVEINMLLALAYKATGDQVAAVEALERALETGETGKYVRTFIGEGEAIAPLLRHIAVRSSHRLYARRLLEIIDGHPSVLPEQSSHFDALSEREVEVLGLVAVGLPNRDIGARLFISEKTVKKHLSNILAKLGVVNRTQAVDQARRLGLI